MPHKVEKLLLDLRIACSEVLSFSSGLSFEDYLKNRLLQLALEREFEIIGEALVRLERIDEESLEQNVPNYRKIIGFRNLVAHGYDIIDDQALWDLCKTHVPKLLSQIENYLS